jgi:hypothetical protein
MTKRNGPPRTDAWRQSPPPVGAPDIDIAGKVWDLLSPRLMTAPVPGSTRARRIDDIIVPWAKGRKLKPHELAALHDTAVQAFAVAVEAAVRAGEDRRGGLYFNTVAGALMRVWSPTYREARGRATWHKKAEALTEARRELSVAGVALDEIWTAICDGIDGLYDVAFIGGYGHARGRRVQLSQEGDLFTPYTLRRPRGRASRARVLPASAPTPKVRVTRQVIAGTDYEVMRLGAASRAVIDVLQGARLLVDTVEAIKYERELDAAMKAHPWPSTYREHVGPLRARLKAKEITREDFQLAVGIFMGAHLPMKKEYASLAGRHIQARALVHEIATSDAETVEIEGRRYLGIKTGYTRLRNRRFGPTHLWASEFPAKADHDVALDIAKTFYADWADEWELDTVKVATSPRGRIFKVHSHEPDGELRAWDVYDDDGKITDKVWADDFVGLVRPLYGRDASGSMYGLIAVLLGWRDAEDFLLTHDFKGVFVAGIDEAIERGDLPPVDATPGQKKKVASKMAPHSYGGGLAKIVRSVNGNPSEFGSGWPDVAGWKGFLTKARAYNESVAMLMRMRDEFWGATRALVKVAEARSPYAGVSFLDPLDGELVRWHAPITERKELPHEGHPLLAVVPVGEPNAEGEYPVNYDGRLVTSKKIKMGKRGKPLKPRTRRVDQKHSVGNLLAPGIVHTLDAAFAGHVVLRLHELGVRDVVAINDCFLVPSDALPLLDIALDEAGAPWFEELAPVYELFIDHLGDDLVYEPKVREWRARWADRREAIQLGKAKAPRFRFKDETTYNIDK